MAGEGVSGALPRSSSAGPGKPMPGWTRSPPSSSAKRDTESRSVSGLPPSPPTRGRSESHSASVRGPRSELRAVQRPQGQSSDRLGRCPPRRCRGSHPLHLVVTRPAGVRPKAALVPARPLPSVGPREHPAPAPPPTTPLPPSRLHVGGLGCDAQRAWSPPPCSSLGPGPAAPTRCPADPRLLRTCRPREGRRRRPRWRLRAPSCAHTRPHSGSYRNTATDLRTRPDCAREMRLPILAGGFGGKSHVYAPLVTRNPASHVGPPSATAAQSRTRPLRHRRRSAGVHRRFQGTGGAQWGGRSGQRPGGGGSPRPPHPGSCGGPTCAPGARLRKQTPDAPRRAPHTCPRTHVRTRNGRVPAAGECTAHAFRPGQSGPRPTQEAAVPTGTDVHTVLFSSSILFFKGRLQRTANGTKACSAQLWGTGAHSE